MFFTHDFIIGSTGKYYYLIFCGYDCEVPMASFIRGVLSFALFT